MEPDLAYYLKMSEKSFVISWKKSCLSKTFFIIHHAYHPPITPPAPPPPPSPPKKRTNFLKDNSFFIISKNAKHFLYLALIIVRCFLSFYNIFFLYSNNLCFSPSGISISFTTILTIFVFFFFGKTYALFMSFKSSLTLLSW